MVISLASEKRLASAITDEEDAHEPSAATPLAITAIEGLSPALPSFSPKAPAPHSGVGGASRQKNPLMTC